MRSNAQPDFDSRPKLLTARTDIAALAASLRAALATHDPSEIRDVIIEHHPADLADAMSILNDEEDLAVFRQLNEAEAAEVLDEVDATTKAALARATAPERLGAILDELPADEATDVVGELSPPAAEEALDETHPIKAAEVRALLAYRHDTAGGIMSLDFTMLPASATVAEALDHVRAKDGLNHLPAIQLVDQGGGFAGEVWLLKLMRAAPDVPLSSLREEGSISVPPQMDQEQVVNIFARYDLQTLPVVSDDSRRRVLGVIFADDVVDVLQAEHTEDILRLAGSDAQELEHKSPVKVAQLRLPWIMATMFIELMAGVVIHFYDTTLTRYILLASFMPVISAISGNTGLQSAAIIIRGLSTGLVRLEHWQHAVMRQAVTSVLLGGACGAVLGTIGAIWSHSWTFGIVIFLGMFIAVNIAGIVGTVVPMFSKHLGFDPALTAGPFETAFQDVIGISIFLSLASLLLGVIH